MCTLVMKLCCCTSGCVQCSAAAALTQPASPAAAAWAESTPPCATCYFSQAAKHWLMVWNREEPQGLRWEKEQETLLTNNETCTTLELNKCRLCARAWHCALTSAVRSNTRAQTRTWWRRRRLATMTRVNYSADFPAHCSSLELHDP